MKRQAHYFLALLFVLVSLITPTASTGAVSSSGVANLPSPSCKVTLPLEGSQNSLPNGNFGNSAIQTGLWANGQVVFEPGGPGSIEPDGSLGMKWWWWRGVQG